MLDSCVPVSNRLVTHHLLASCGRLVESPVIHAGRTMPEGITVLRVDDGSLRMTASGPVILESHHGFLVRHAEVLRRMNEHLSAEPQATSWALRWRWPTHAVDWNVVKWSNNL